MARVKGGVKGRRRHNRILADTKGHFGARHKHIRKATESRLHALAYATEDRRNHRRELHALWVQRINAAARENGTTYSRLMNALKTAGIALDRKILSDIASRDSAVFSAVVHAAA
jgi:large subunit ribosomal protein L20